MLVARDRVSQRTKLGGERAGLMESERVDQRPVDALGVEIEKLARERELVEASIRGWMKREADAKRKDAEALTARAVAVMQKTKVSIESAQAKLQAAIETFESVLDEALGYESLLRRVTPLAESLGVAAPTLPGDEIDAHTRERQLDALAARVYAAYDRLLDKVSAAVRELFRSPQREAAAVSCAARRRRARRAADDR